MIFYSVSRSHAPELYFAFDPRTWQVYSVDAKCDPAWGENCVQVGDQLVMIDGFDRETYLRERWQPTIRWKMQTDAVVLRDGQRIPIVIHALSPTFGSHLEGVVAACFPLLFWLMGTFAVIAVRPRDERWWVLIAFYYITALFFASGFISKSRVGLSSLVLHVTAIMSMPVVVHLHLILPRPLFRHHRRVAWAMYVIATFLLILDLSGAAKIYQFFWIYLSGILIGLGIVLFRSIWSNEIATLLTSRMLLFGVILGIIPWVAAAITFTIGRDPSLDVKIDTVLLGCITLVALPNWGISYLNAIYRHDLGPFQVRANRMVGIYGFTSLYITIYLTAYFLLGMRFAVFQAYPLVTSMFASVIFVAFAPTLYSRFQLFVDRAIFGIPYQPHEVVNAFAERIPAAVDRRALRRIVLDEVLPTLQIEQSALYLFDQEQARAVYAQAVDGSETVDVSTLRMLQPAGGRYLNRDMRAHLPLDWVRLVQPLQVHDETIGIWLLGNRQPDGFYSRTDVALISKLANQIAPVLRIQLEIDENRRLHEQLVQAHKMEAIGRLSSGLAHDFNNLLSVILGYTHLMLMEYEDDLMLQGYLQDMRAAGEKAAALTKQLLAFSRQQVVEVKVVDLNRLVGDMQGLLQRLLTEEIQLDLQLQDGLPHVRVNAGQIEQVIMNLASNGVDAMPNGGTLTLSTHWVGRDENAAVPGLEDLAVGQEYVMLSVQDTGTGIDPDVMERIFEPFFTTKDVGEGTGLGLSMVYGIVRQCGGTIRADSEPGAGTRFAIYLPGTVEEIQTPVAAVRAARTDEGSETILLVEDEDSVRAVVYEILRSRGYRVIKTSGGMEALDVFAMQGDQIDLLLTDVIMPQMKGTELAAHLLELQPELRVIYMSGYNEEKISGKQLGRDGSVLIAKPFAPEELTRRVREMLDAVPAQQANPPSGSIAASADTAV
ncbi:MAG: ATP-binding protein [Acidobacteriota bacterium]